MRNVSHPIPSLTLHFVERRISPQRAQFEVPDPLRLAPPVESWFCSASLVYEIPLHRKSLQISTRELSRREPELQAGWTPLKPNQLRFSLFC